MPPALKRRADSLKVRDNPYPANSDIWRIDRQAVRDPEEASYSQSSAESAEFREVIAYMKGVADALSVYERETLAAPATSEPMPATTNSRRVTLPYGGPHLSTFEDEGFERGSGVRLQNVAPSSELYELAGVKRCSGE